MGRKLALAVLALVVALGACVWIEAEWLPDQRRAELRLRTPAEVGARLDAWRERVAKASKWASREHAKEASRDRSTGGRSASMPAESLSPQSASEEGVSGEVEEDLTWKDRRELDRLVEESTRD